MKALKKKLKGSYSVEAAFVLPIFIVVTVIMLLSYRRICLDSVVDSAMEEANLELSAKIMRLGYSGLFEDYKEAPAGQKKISDDDLENIYNNLNCEDFWSGKDYKQLGGAYINNRKEFKEDAEGVTNLVKSLKEVYRMTDSYGCNYGELKKIYDYPRKVFESKGDLCKEDYEALFTYLFKKAFIDNIKEFHDSRYSDYVFSLDDIVIKDWDINIEKNVMKYSCKVTYKMKIPFPLVSNQEWERTATMTGYAYLGK